MFATRKCHRAAVWVALACCASLFVLPAPSAAQTTLTCEVIGFSPRFEADHTMLCASNEYAAGSGFPTGNLLVRKSQDGGMTWSDLPAVGLQGLGLAFPSQVVVSPEYPERDTIYVHVVYGNNPGIYRSSDGGDTFVNVAPLASTGYVSRALTPFLMPQELTPPPLGNGRDAFAYATRFDRRAALVAPPVHEPVVGAPGVTEAFVLPPDFPASSGYAVSGIDDPNGDPTAPQPLYSLYRCDAALSCLTKVHDFPVGWSFVDGRMLPDGSAYIVMRDRANEKVLEVWRTGGDGVPRKWASLNSRLPDIAARNASFPLVSVVGTPGAPGRLYARISYVLRSHEKGPPTDQILSTGDGGETWRRIAFGRGVTQPGRVRGVEWQLRAGPPHSEGDLYMPSSDRLMVVAQRVGSDGTNFIGPYCSFDGGKSWIEGCRGK
jgi:hypothetical protein